LDNYVLFKDAQILSMDDSIGDFQCADLLIKNSKIESIGKSIQIDNAQVINAKEFVIIPGFVDTHRHTWQTQLHGIRTDWNHLDYMTYIRSMYCVCYEPEDAGLGNYVGAIEALNSGITTLADHSHLQITEEHSDALASGIIKSGIRGIFLYGTYRNPSYKPGEKILSFKNLINEVTGPLNQWHRQNAFRIKEKYFSSTDSLIEFGIACSELSRGKSVELAIEEIEWARSLNPKRMSLHVATNRNEPINIVKELSIRNLIKDDILFVHGNHLSNSELKSIVNSGSTISSNIEPEMSYGAFPVVNRLSQMGGCPCLGIDVLIDFSSDMFGQMRALLNVWRLEIALSNFDKMVRKIHQKKVLEIATINGAKALGLDHKIGSLTPGKEADLVLIKTEGLGLTPMNNPYNAVVTYGHPSNVDSVMVAGKFAKRNGNLLNVHWPSIKNQLNLSRDNIIKKYHLIPETSIRKLWKDSFNVKIVDLNL